MKSRCIFNATCYVVEKVSRAKKKGDLDTWWNLNEGCHWQSKKLYNSIEHKFLATKIYFSFIFCLLHVAKQLLFQYTGRELLTNDTTTPPLSMFGSALHSLGESNLLVSVIGRTISYLSQPMLHSSCQMHLWLISVIGDHLKRYDAFKRGFNTPTRRRDMINKTNGYSLPCTKHIPCQHKVPTLSIAQTAPGVDWYNARQ